MGIVILACLQNEYGIFKSWWYLTLIQKRKLKACKNFRNEYTMFRLH